MSDQPTTKQRDAGMTLPELLIGVILTGMLVISISTASIVALRTVDNSSGRLSNARSEQSVNVWMPSDLTSAENVRTEANLLPCGPQAGTTKTFAACPSSLNLSNTSNVMLVTWYGSTTDAANEPVATVALVSYRYGQIDGEWVLQRVRCNATETGKGTQIFGPWSCESMIVLRAMPGPPPGITWVPGTTSPEWVVKVTSALAADSTVADGADVVDPGLASKNARRVLVTIDGGGDAAGLGGGSKTFSFSAGGTNREATLSTDALSGAPTFTASRTRCGGSYGLIVDRSGSIGSDFPNVRSGLLTLIDTLAGKPVRLQIVTFDTTADTIDRPSTSSDDWVAYFDMLDTTPVTGDVAVLKAAVSTLTVGNTTNWEDGWFRMLRNQDGSLRTIVPDKVIFFTDGMPNTSRLSDRSAGSASAVADPRDNGLSNTTRYNMNQVAWNRTARIVEDTGITDVVGVYIGADVTKTARWEYNGAGWVWQYEYGSAVQFQRGFTTGYERGNALAFERGFHNDKQRANTVVYERGYNSTYQLVSGLTFQRRSDSRLVFERFNGSSWVTTTSGGSTITWTTYITNNTVAGDSDGWRARLNNGGSATWTNITLDEFVETNLTTDSNDGFRISGSTSGSWNNITTAQYNAVNTTSDSSDGVRETRIYTTPYSAWESSTQSSYNGANTVAGDTDGWRARVTGTPSSWTNVTDAEFNASNATSDESDGYRLSANDYRSPYTNWETSNWSAYNAANSSSGESDGWRARTTGTSTTWTAITQSEYNESNVTADETDGFRTTLIPGGTAVWQQTTKALYDAGNTVSGQNDGWRTSVVGSNTTWNAVPKAEYDRSNTTTNSSDGWQVVQAYPPTGPYEGYLASTYSTDRPTREILEKLVAPEGVVPAVYNAAAGAYGYTDASGQWKADVRDVNMFASTNWSSFGTAVRDIALGECGGTVTIQTRNQVTGSPVADTFAYSNAQLQTVETSSAYRSGTFDVAQPGGSPSTLAITLQNLSTLNAWQHVSWSCTSQGSPMVAPDMTVGPGDAAGWKGLNVVVRPNQAISCTHLVKPRS